MIQVNLPKSHAAFRAPMRTISEFMCKELDLLNESIHINIVTLPIKLAGKVTHNHTNNAFNIQLNKNSSFATWVKFLAHELTHIRQMKEGRLIIVDDKHIHWVDPKGRVSTHQPVDIDLNFDQDTDFDKYKELPWEREAYTEQERLYIKCESHFHDLTIKVFDGVEIELF